jgi:hypothetical protein
VRPDDGGESGIGCRPFLTALVALSVIAAAAVAVGLSLALAEDPSPLAERLGFALYGTGAPISALFAAVAGELPLAPLTDIVVWIVAAAGVVKWAERRAVPVWRPISIVLAVALCYGLVVSSFLERV